MALTTLGRYQILDRLGHGGMGEVYVADDPALGRRVAIKVLPRAVESDPERRGRLVHEARAASALNHPNIVVIHDIGESDGSLFVAMELIEGRTVRDWARSGPVTTLEILRLARQIAAALAVAHDAGLVHRDLKPENLMVRRDGLLKILDFGLARSVSPGVTDATATMPGLVVGTVPYMSPEQVLGQPAGPASDLFSLGVILYELLTGRHPFDAAAAVDTMHRILHDTPVPPSRLNPALGADFDFVIGKMLAKDARRRHASARDLDVDLETLERALAPVALEARGVAPAATPKAIAVLPFKNIGGDPTLQYLGMGFADAVITRLSVSPDLVVRATGAVSRYLDQAVDPCVVGLELEADMVLDASFQRAGDRLRATARLVDAPSGRALWADKVDVRFEDIFEVQDQVALGIAGALTARLSDRSSSGARGGPRFVPSPEAYRLVMKANESWRTADRAGYERAIVELEQAVRLSPEYAEAWAMLGSSYHSMVDGGFSHEPAWYDKAALALERAKALDPDEVKVHYLAAAQHLVHGRKREAYRELIASNRHTPHNWGVHHYTGYLFRLCDMLEEAMLACQRSVELEPNLPWSYWSIIRGYYILGRYDEAEEWRERLSRRFGRFRDPRTSAMLAMLYQGRFEEIVKGYEAGDFTLEQSRAEFNVALAYRAIGNVEKAESLWSSFEPMALIDMDSAGDAAAYYAHAGEPDRAFLYLDRAVALGLDTTRLYENPALYGPLHGLAQWPHFIQNVKARVAEYRREFVWPLP